MFKRDSAATTVLAAAIVFVGVLALIAVLAMFEAWVLLSVINWAWPDLPEALSPTFAHICGVAVVLWVLQSTFQAHVTNKKKD